MECQLETLRKCINRSAIRRALYNLPKNLDETHERILRGIPEEYQREAQCIFHLLVVSRRPLKLAEVAEALAVNCETETFDPEDRLRDQHDILEICSSLITLSGYMVLASSINNQEQI